MKLLLLTLLLISLIAQAETRTEITLPNETDLLVQQFHSDNETLIIWVPSEYGLRSGSMPFAYNVQAEGVDIWMVDLHQTYMAPVGRNGFKTFEYEDIYWLIDYAVKQGWKNIYLGGESRAANLALKAARQWQIKQPDKPVLKGLVFFHPHLIDGYTEIGDKADYVKIAKESNLPIYLFQPQYSTKYLRSKELIKHLEVGGSQVFFHPLLGINGGYHLRPDDDLNEADIIEKAKAGERVARALKMLAFMPLPQTAANEYKGKLKKDSKREGYKLKAMQATTPPKLNIKDQFGKPFDLTDVKNEVVLINFWATWCGPCVEEIPSLMRLSKKMKGKPFKVVTVNIGETPKHVIDFFNVLKIKPNFEVLFDTDGKAVDDWKIYAYPSNYLLDKNHQIRYGYRGALHWDDENTVKIIEALIAE